MALTASASLDLSLPLAATVIILSRDEESNIRHAIESVRPYFADIVVVDSGSADATPSIVRAYGVRLFLHPAASLSDQVRWALTNCDIKTDWVFRLDADERVSDVLLSELRQLLPALPATCHGVVVKRRIVFMNRWIRFGGLYPNWQVRLWRKDKAIYEPRSVDEHLVFDSHATLHYCQGHITDWNLKGLTPWLQKHDAYAIREAHEF